jgi:hypothetical protein
VFFLLTIAVDGPVVHGAGGVIDTLDLVAIMAWYEMLGLHLLAASARGGAAVRALSPST